MGSLHTNLAMLALLLLAIASSALAHEGHDDGHVIEWTITGEPFELCVNPGEPVTFKWEGAAHNVVMVESKDDYDNCFVPEDMRRPRRTGAASSSRRGRRAPTT